MKAMVVYDSYFGCTKKVALAIGEALAGALGKQGEVEALRVGDVDPQKLSGLDLLVLGSPTRQFRASDSTRALLKAIPREALKGVRVAAFDTRFGEEMIRETSGILNFFVGIFGYAAEPVSKQMAKKGGEVAAPPAGFIVEDTEGPLVGGELERAAEWARGLAAS